MLRFNLSSKNYFTRKYKFNMALTLGSVHTFQENIKKVVILSETRDLRFRTN